MPLTYAALEVRLADAGGKPEATFRFRVPDYVSPVVEVFRVDADGVATVDHSVGDGSVTIRDRVSRVAVYVVATAPGERDRIEARRQALIAGEKAIDFDPGHKPEDLAGLREMIRRKER